MRAGLDPANGSIVGHVRKGDSMIRLTTAALLLLTTVTPALATPLPEDPGIIADQSLAFARKTPRHRLCACLVDPPGSPGGPNLLGTVEFTATETDSLGSFYVRLVCLVPGLRRTDGTRHGGLICDRFEWVPK